MSISNLQYIPPDFEKRCAAYRTALEDVYASGSLDDAGRLRLKRERKRIKLRAEDAREIEDGYLQENAFLLLERRLQAQFEAVLEHSRALERRRLSDAARRFRGIEANIATLKERLEQTQRLHKALDRLERQLNTVEAHSVEGQERILARLEQLQQEVARSAKIPSRLPQRLDTIEAHQRELFDYVQHSQARSASQAETLADLEQRLQATLANQTQLRHEVQEALANTQSKITALVQRLRVDEDKQRELWHEMQRLQARTATHAEIRALEQGLRDIEARQTLIFDSLEERLRAIEAHQREPRHQIQHSPATHAEIRALQQALQDVEARRIPNSLQQRLQAIEAKTRVTELTLQASNSASLVSRELNYNESGPSWWQLSGSYRDFIVEARFYNPYARSTRGWDYGFAFRHTGENQHYRLVVNSERDWFLELVTWQNKKQKVKRIANGKVENLNLSADGSNHLHLVAEDETAFFFVNHDYVATLDISEKNVSGYVLLGAGFSPQYKLKDKSTRCENVTLLSWGHLRERIGALQESDNRAQKRIWEAILWTIGEAVGGIIVGTFLGAIGLIEEGGPSARAGVIAGIISGTIYGAIGVPISMWTDEDINTAILFGALGGIYGAVLGAIEPQTGSLIIDSALASIIMAFMSAFFAILIFDGIPRVWEKMTS